VYYSDLRNPQPVRDYCLARLRRVVAAHGGEIVPSICTEGSPSHARLYGQILDGLARAGSDRIFLCEDDVLYPDAHFTQMPRLSGFGFNRNVWHLSAQGYFPNAWPGVFLSSCFGDRDALWRAIAAKREEACRGALVHAEPDGGGRAWQTDVPLVDVRHGVNFTGMRLSSTPVSALAVWGDAEPHLRAMRLLGVGLAAGGAHPAGAQRER
jgi:hypothetical protein